jgi:hypothetical protein
VTDHPIVIQFPLWGSEPPLAKQLVKTVLLHQAWLRSDSVPPWLTHSPTVQRILAWLGALQWDALPERDLQRRWCHPPVPYAALSAALLIKLNEGLRSFADLHQFLHEHAAFIPLLGFPLVPDLANPHGFHPLCSLPTPRHFTQLLRQMPNAVLQWLLNDSVQLILTELAARQQLPIECVSLDTKHILAWVQANTPKAYVTNRFDKTQQPRGDPDCRLGCKRKHNLSTPTRNPQSAHTLQVGEYYWGYASGLVVAKVPDAGEFVLAELTQPFDHGDTTYFFPLMHQTEQRLGYRPRYATFDAAFDAWYVYAHFYRDNEPDAGYALVPFSEKGSYKVDERHFSAEGWPVCQAGLAMPLKFTYTDRTKDILVHERGLYVCPLVFPKRGIRTCPVRHPQWAKGGCTVNMPTSIGARLRYTLNRESEEYKQLYKQRTAVERINSQAVALGIERPHLRNGTAIANQNTLIYILINLRFLQRLRQA